MFTWAIGCGVFSLYIWALGLFGLLQYPYILLGTAAFILFSYYLLSIHFSIQKCRKFIVELTRLEKVCVTLLIFTISVNLLGALGPELGYDAVWYHLTIPRIWLMEHEIFFIPFGPFSYSLLPKLLEMLYLPALLLGNHVWAKVIHWGFGCLTGIITYQIARNFVSKKWALLAVLIFYSNLVVGWQAITAYIDLGRTFFESLTLLAALYAVKTRNKQWWYISGSMVGLAILSKILAIASLVAIVILLLERRAFKLSILVSGVALAVPLPWLALNFIQTGNPIFPIFSQYDLSSTTSVWDILTIWWQSADPISPLYMMLIPISILFALPRYQQLFTQSDKETLNLFWILSKYLAIVLVVWWLTPRTGGGRFILPYLPACSVFILYPLSRIKVKNIQSISIAAIIFMSIFSSFYRLTANWKYLPVLSGKKSQQEFLSRHLPQNFGDNWYYLTDESLRRLYTQPDRPEDLQWQYQ